MTENSQTESTEDVNLGADKEKENSADSSSVETTDTNSTDSSNQDKDSQTSDKNESGDNFADHPRWKEREDDWKSRFNQQETRHAEEVRKAIEATEAKYAQKREELADTEIPDWFGGDAAAWKQYKAHEDKRLEQAEERAIERLEKKSEEKAKAIKEATDYFNDEVGKLEADKTINPDGTKVDRNKLLKFTIDNDIVRSDGKWNYRAAFIAMRGSGSTSTAKNNNLDEKKKLAGATNSNDRGDTKDSKVSTSEDFKGKNWGNV